MSGKYISELNIIKVDGELLKHGIVTGGRGG